MVSLERQLSMRNRQSSLEVFQMSPRQGQNITVSSPSLLPASFHHKVELPTRSSYTKYIDFFFKEINPYYPCVNEAHFRERSKRLVTKDFAENDDEKSLLALHYIIFACSEMLLDIKPLANGTPSSESEWLFNADNVYRKLNFNERWNSRKIQFLVYKVCPTIIDFLLINRLTYQSPVTVFHVHKQARDCIRYHWPCRYILLQRWLTL